LAFLRGWCFESTRFVVARALILPPRQTLFPRLPLGIATALSAV
jgi:hypothetical protein